MKKKDLELLLQEPWAVKELLNTRFEYFCRFVLPHHFTSDPGKVHRDWYWLLEQTYSVAIACPRSHGKSTVFSLAYPLWQVLSGKKDFIVIISDTQSQAEALLGSIVEELETNELLIKIYGKIAGYVPPKAEDKQKWTAKEIVTTTGIKIMARGWSSKLRGIKHGAHRPDLIIIDDIENDIAVNSQEQRHKLKKIFQRSILNLGNKKTKVVMVGTILHFDSLLQNIIDEPPPKWEAHLYRAIQNGVPLWSEYYSLEDLENKKNEIGSLAFEQEWMNNPLDESEQIIKFDKFYTTLPENETLEAFGYIDLAISEKDNADYTAIVTLLKSKKTGIIYIHDVIQLRISVDKQLNLVFSKHSRFDYQAFGVESVAYQKAFFDLLTQESRKRGIYLPVHEVKIDRDKVRRVQKISKYIENGTIIVNKALDEFITQCRQFPKGAHDDMVDAFAGAVDLAINAYSPTLVSTSK